MTDNASRRRMVEGYEPNWDLDLPYGEVGQLWVVDVAEAITSGSVEIKRDGRWYQTGCLFVEYECRHVGGRWRPSGLATTNADVWIFKLGDLGVGIIVETPLLKEYCREMYRRGGGHLAEQTAGSHPTKGVRLRVTDFLLWMQRRQVSVSHGDAS